MPARDIQLMSVSIVIILLCCMAGEAHFLNDGPPEWYIKSFWPKGTPLTPHTNDIPAEGELVTKTVLSSSGHTSEGSSSEVNFIIDTEGVQKIVVSLSWQDDLGEADTLGLAVSFGGKELDALQGSSGSLDIEYTPDNGTDPKGDYTVSVKAVDCPGVVSLFPIDRDSGNDWSLTVKISVLE